jgi:5-methylthioribose kinase
LEEHSKHAPQFVPKLYHYDDTMSLTIMEYLPPPHIILRRGLIQGIGDIVLEITRPKCLSLYILTVQGIIYPSLADHVSEFLANVLFKTSSLSLSSEEKRKRISVLNNNIELCKATEQVVFTDPYIESPLNRWTSPQLDEEAKALRTNGKLKIAISELKRKFLDCHEAHIHGDLHTGSIMCTTSK